MSEQQKADQRIYIRVTEEQRAKLEREAARQGRTVSNLVKFWIDSIEEEKK